ncbi:ankyrin [Colletotrichum zoysiae]|uniref:Ankyrin n=1 Tax=Colletotrichum zoysiae TaxID=1216348 RepID=A0AAD9LXX0_9PEZI|nr:ankyrin [Colletotrichum zoysiae]
MREKSCAFSAVAEPSNSKYEAKPSVFNNDRAWSKRMPFDTLFKTTFSPNTPCDPLLEAVISKHKTTTECQEALAEYMLRSGSSVNARTNGGITPLMASVRCGRLGLTNLLLKHGADPRIADAGGCTPLIAATQSSRQDLVEALLASGAEPNAQLDALAPEKCGCVSFMSGPYGMFDRSQVPGAAQRSGSGRGPWALRYRRSPAFARG